jgi:hypothetical protein
MWCTVHLADFEDMDPAALRLRLAGGSAADSRADARSGLPVQLKRGIAVVDHIEQADADTVARGGSMIATEKIRATFAEHAKRKPDHLQEGNIVGKVGSAWLLGALSLVETTFGETHAITRSMRTAIDYALANVSHGPEFRKHDAAVGAAEGAFWAAVQIVDSDGIHGLIDIVRAETEADLLNQADTLLDKGALAAAAVIAGGALETHLWGLIDRIAISWQQHGERGIATYNMAIASHRKKHSNSPLYSAATGDSISGWAKMRNDAAHEPLEFPKKYSAERVKQMIDGIRLVISGGQ